jgi:hypothetical protein
MFSNLSARKAAFLFAGFAALVSPATAGTHPGSAGTALTLLNGWTNAPFNTAIASVELINGIVHFKGAIAKTGDNAEPFVLPAAFRPASRVYIPIDACGSTNARLDILPSGDVSVETEGSFDKGKCFISLDNATFAVSSDGFTPLKLLHGWSRYDSDAAVPAVQLIDGVVHFEGAIGGSKKNPIPFKMPAKFRPAETVYVKVDLCNATNGRLEIDADGTVNIEVFKKFSNAKCFTSLDGASYALKTNGFTTLSLINGWNNYFGDRPAAVNLVNGVVQFAGALETSGTDATAFVLPSAYRPSQTVYLPVDECDATNGRIVITSDGNVDVQAEDDFSFAQCFTSLEGVSFVK